jgi:uncharacterized protein YegL
MSDDRATPFAKAQDDELFNNPTKRCPCLLVLDTSSSMEGKAIDELNRGVRQFVDALKRHEIASTSVELGIITFDSEVTDLIDFTIVEQVQVPTLSADGMTAMGEAVGRAIQRLRDRRRQYADAGVSSYVPWLVLMTDGGPNDDWEAPAQRLKTLGEQRKLIVFGVGIGDSCDFDTLGRFCPADRPPLHLAGYHFEAFFAFMSKSLEQVTTGSAPDGGFALAAAATNSSIGEDPDDWD